MSGQELQPDAEPRDAARRHARSIDLLGEEGFGRLRAATVAVFGLGGVGSHAALALARSGVGRLRLVDFDTVSWSSLNRSAFALPVHVGQPKVKALQDVLARLDAQLEVDALQTFFHDETAEALLARPLDFVVDAIDSVGPKVALLRGCHARSLPVVSCMGASARTDPLALRIGDIGDTRICPLARTVRRGLARVGIREGITAVYSIEPGRASLPPDLSEQTLARGRMRRRLPSLGMMPAIFGHAAASVVVRGLVHADPEQGRCFR